MRLIGPLLTKIREKFIPDLATDTCQRIGHTVDELVHKLESKGFFNPHELLDLMLIQQTTLDMMLRESIHIFGIAYASASQHFLRLAPPLVTI
jgi:hypothetical protein